MVRIGVAALLAGAARLARVAAAAGLLVRAAAAQQRPAPPPPDAAPTLVLVANGGVPGTVDREQVRRVFLLRARFWRDGSRAAPVNLPAASPLRDLFSRRVLGRPARDFAGYWNDLYFHGTQPPPTLASEQAVLLFVARTPGAIGYVSAESVATLPEGVRVVLEVR